MSVLIEDLKKEHAEVAGLLKEVKRLGIGSREGKAKLLLAKDGLLSHLKKEDEQLYPVLKKESEKNEELKRTLEIFAHEMEGISGAVLNFFEKYSGSAPSGLEFAKDLGGIFVGLETRIRREENILYREYEKIKQ
ncbi:hemerythrin domain-containing protein [bacterium]|nr:MAG: hemerythrin domain-containing protein [bacterium]